MAKKLNLSDEIKQGIIDDYKNGMKTKDIIEKYNTCAGTLNKIVRASGVPMRVNRSTPAKKAKHCSNCRKKVDVKGAAFCPYCGSDIRSDKELLVERVDKLIDYNPFIPAHVRDEYIEVLNKTVNILKTD